MRFFSRAMLVFALLLPASVTASAAGAAPASRHYDCSKPGNANKAACKSSSETKAPAVKTSTTKATTTTTTRHYDCTKAGNANKAACRTAAKESPSGKAAGAETKTTKTVATTTDCTKWYNKMRATCHTSASSSPARTTVAPAPKPSATASKATKPAAGSGEGVNKDPKGAIAQCKDGTYSHAAHRSGACSRHGGVAKWLAS